MESEKDLKQLMAQFQHSLNLSIDEKESCASTAKDSQERAAFMGMMVEYIKHNYLLYKQSVREQVESFLTKVELSKNFILSSIEEGLLNASIEDIIQMLEASPIEHKRNCFSLIDHQVNAHKMLFDLKKVFIELNEESLMQFKQGHSPIQPNANLYGNVIRTIEKKPKGPFSLDKTPNFGKQSRNKKFEAKTCIQPHAKENKLAAASMYHSPSPVILSKTKKVFGRRNYQTPEKKHNWL